MEILQATLLMSGRTIFRFQEGSLEQWVGTPQLINRLHLQETSYMEFDGATGSGDNSDSRQVMEMCFGHITVSRTSMAISIYCLFITTLISLRETLLTQSCLSRCKMGKAVQGVKQPLILETLTVS